MKTLASLAAALLLPLSAGASTDNTPVTATLVSMTHLVRVKLAADANPTEAKPGMALPEGSQVMTLADARAHIRFDDGHFILLSGSTSVTIQRLPKKGAWRTLVQLVKGKVQALINRGMGEGDFGMYGATTITAVKGTDYEMTRDDADQVNVDVNEGKVDAGELKKKDDAGEADAAMKALIMGLVGMTLMEGQRVSCPAGGHMTKPMSMPRRMESGGPRGGGEHGGSHHPDSSGGKGGGGKGGHGGKGGGAPGMPSLPGLPF